MRSLKIHSWLLISLYGQAAFADEAQNIAGPIWLMFVIGSTALLLLLWRILVWYRRRKRWSGLAEGEACLIAEQRSYPIRSPVFRIGRAPDNDLCLDQDTVSAYHAELHRDDNGNYSVFDLDSTNGVRVNGQRIRRHTLEPGDQLALGELLVRFEQAES